MEGDADCADGPGELLPASHSRASVFLAVVRRSGPHIIESSLIPTAIFYCCLVLAGLGAAYAGAIVWLYAAVVCRLVRHRPIPPLLVLGVIGITVRTAVAVSSGSAFFYFAQPILASLVMGCVFLVSIAIGRPMVERLALEFWPPVARLLRGLTFWWAGINLAIAATTLLLLLWLPMATYVAVKQATSLALMGIGVAVTIDLALRTARREGLVAARTRRPTRRWAPERVL
jgi:intracellular septation protein A